MNDVCLILEGTYPYVAGGVSTWVYQLIKHLRDFTFSIVYLGSHRAAAKKMHYDIPANVMDFREIYLFDYRVRKEKLGSPEASDLKKVESLLAGLRGRDVSRFDDVVKIFGAKKRRRIDLHDLVHSREGWNMLLDLYRGEAENASFLDYFWTWRFLYLPFFSLLRLPLPPARVYHAVSTGYAGVLGAMSKVWHGRPFLLTEHGIYTRERKFEIARADWIYSEAAQEAKVVEGRDFFKEWWMALFSFASRLAYDRADEIITLYEGNRAVQIEEGAAPEKIRLVPNGVDFEGFSRLPRRTDPEKFTVGFVGRVVPIKDIKTFLKACKKIHAELPNVEFLILGPTDEDEEYYEECRLMAEMSALEKVVRFAGKVNLREYYPRLDVLVLTSISEAQPIVILEANACGIPAVATDVGACRELLQGSSPDDRLLGPSGVVTPVCDPEATAQAVIRLLRNPELRQRMGQAGRRRVEQYYQLEDWIAAYESIYSRNMEEVRWPA
jgi:glycosyltransferase involved in cell wall biosynthesis